VTEGKLRSYIRREVVQESLFSGAVGVVGQGTFLGSLLSSFDNVIDAARLAFKDILTSVHFLIKVSFAADAAAIAEITSKFKTKKERIASEYASFWNKLDESMSTDFKGLAYLMAPGPYIAAKLTMEGPGYANDLKEFFYDAGFDIDFPAARPDAGMSAAEREQIERSNDWLRGQAKSYKQVLDIQQKVLASLDSRLGVGSSTTESVEQLPVIVEDRGEKVIEGLPNFKMAAEMNSKSFMTGIEKVDSKKLVKPEVARQMIDAKKEEVKGYVESLNRPAQLMVQLSKATTLDETRKIVSSLKNSPVKITAFSADEEQKLVEAAKKMVVEAKEKKKQSDLFKAAGVDPKQEQTDEKLLDAAIVVLTKEAIANFIRIVSNPQQAGQEGKNLLEAFQVARRDFTNAFMEGLDESDFEIIKKTKIGSELADVMAKGKKDIANAGLTRPTSG